MLKIGDFSKLTRVSVRMLRYYDSQGLLKPDCVDPESGYRMYSAKQAPVLQRIILLRDLDFGVAEIAELLRSWDGDTLTRALEGKLAQTWELINEQKRRAERIKAAVAHIADDRLEQYANMTVRQVDECGVVSLRRRVPDYFCEGTLWQELSELVRREHIEIERDSRNNVALYHDAEHGEAGVDMEVCFVTKCAGGRRGSALPQGAVFRTLEAAKMACAMVYGSYENIAAAYTAFIGWLEANPEYRLGRGASRQITIIDERSAADPRDYLTEIQIPLE